MENLETMILVAGSLAVACAFGWTAICRLMLLVASGSTRINASEGPAISRIRHLLPAVPAAGFDDIGVPHEDRRDADPRVGSAVVIDLGEWKYAAATRLRLENNRRPIAVFSRGTWPARGAGDVVRRP
jgi:hypothetical protein